MNDLQIALIVAGIVLILGVYLWTRIQDRKARKDEEASYRAAQDALLDASQEPLAFPEDKLEPIMKSDGIEPEKKEPPLSTSEIPLDTPLSNDNFYESLATIEEEPIPLLHQETLASEEQNSEAQLASKEQDEDEKLPIPREINPMFDYICGISATNNLISGKQILAAKESLNISKLVQWVGALDNQKEWEEINEDSRYRIVCVGLQLTDRRGPITEEELDAFCDFIAKFADSIQANADMPSTSHVLQQAYRCDDFCADVDIQVGLNVLSLTGNPFLGTKIRALAEASGCILGDDGCFHRIDVATGQELFTLFNLGEQLFEVSEIKHLRTYELGLTLDVPLVNDGVMVFNQMLLFAKQLAQTLGGQLVDSNHRPINEPMIEAIRKQLGAYQQKMRQESVEPGSTLARRLFR